MKTKFLIFNLLLIYSTITFSQNKIIGKWLSEDKEAITSIYENNGKFYGKLTWLKTPKDKNGKPYTDTENPSKTLRKRPLIGLIMLSDFYFKDNQWEDGKIYDPESGKTYNCTMWLTDNNNLKVRGYWGFLYQTQVWTKKE